MEIDQELLEAFYQEARENIDALCTGTSVLKTYQNKQAGQDFNKEEAYMKKTQMHGLVRSMKEILRAANDNALELSPDLVSLLSQGAEACKTLLKEPSLGHYDQLLEKLKQAEAKL
jgi:chemotaxis protein histidine kinase CheA